MTVVTVRDLHLAPDPRGRLARAATLARGENGTDAHRLVVAVPDRAADGVQVFTAADVAALLQRHGRLAELDVTDGGTIVAAADLCERRGEVAVWTGWAIGAWQPEDIVNRGLGGSETAAVRLSEELAAMGFIVTLYGQFEGPPRMAGDVMLRDFREFDPTAPLDVLVGFRDATLFEHRPNATSRILWLEDLAPAEGLTPGRARNIDKVCAVSHFHRRQVLDTHPWLEEGKVAACRNGIVPAWFSEEPAPERERRIVYSSSPDRGGDIVLECFPAIREEVPDAELILTYPRWFDLCAERWQQAQEHLARIRELLEQPGVHRVEGGMGQKALANLMRSSLVWAAPSFHTPAGQKFDETSCISCMEAQAAGCVVVASKWGALAENVGHGTLLEGDPSEPDGNWRHAFIDAVIEGLTNETVQSAAQTIGPEMVRELDWRGAAEQLASYFHPAARKVRR